MSQTYSLQKSREELKAQGYQTWIVEKPWSIYTKRREDLFNLFDLVGIRSDVVGVTGVQACGEDVQEHIRKILEGDAEKKLLPNPYVRIWLEAGNRFFIWGWRLRGAKGKRKMYELREVEMILKDGQVIAHETSAQKQIS